MTRFSVRLYATGDLADEFTAYQAKASNSLGISVCLPYCPLMDDIDKDADVTTYVKLLDSAIVAAPQRNDVIVEVVEAQHSPKRHTLMLSSPWVETVVGQFKTSLQGQGITVTTREPLYIVLAAPESQRGHDALLPLSEGLNWTAKAGWDVKLCLYRDGDWSVEAGWPVQQP